jgi:hypothetical protein
MQPFPPSPAFTRILASSTNIRRTLGGRYKSVVIFASENGPQEAAQANEKGLGCRGLVVPFSNRSNHLRAKDYQEPTVNRCF